jgi:hypothetical protein
MTDSVFLIAALKYLVLAACSGCWAYAMYHGVIFEGRLRAKDPFEIEALNRPAAVFRRNLPQRALEARRKAFTALAIFAVLGVCLLVILYFDASGPAKSPFLFHDRRMG